MTSIRVVFLLLLLSLCANTKGRLAPIQPRSEIGSLASPVRRVESANTELQLVTEIIKQTYCDGPDPELLTLRLLLRLTFTNVGDQRIVLERGSNQVPLVRISKTPEDAIADRVEKTFHNFIITPNERPAKSPNRPTLNRFVFLGSGDSYKSVADVDIPVPRLKPLTASVDPGSHYLQIAVWTWSEPQEKAKRMRRKWRRDGFLWSETILSKPMLFTVVQRPEPEDCRCPNPKINQDQAVDIAARQMSVSKQSVSSYNPIAFEQGCEWHVVFRANGKDSNRASLTYVIDKNSGEVLEELR